MIDLTHNKAPDKEKNLSKNKQHTKFPRTIDEQKTKPTRFSLIQTQASGISQKTVWRCVLAKDQRCPAAMLGTDLCSIRAARQ